MTFFRDDNRTDIITSAEIRTGDESYSILQAFGARGARECAINYNPTAYSSGIIENLDIGLRES